MVQNKYIAPAKAKPIHKKLEIDTENFKCLHNLIFATQQYPQNLEPKSIQELGWKSMWKNDDLEDEEEEFFINYLSKNNIFTFYVALTSEILNKKNTELNVAETAYPCAWTMSYFRAGYVLDNHRFFNDLACMTSVYFSLPIEFIFLRNGDSMLDTRIFAGPENFLEAMKNSCSPDNWNDGLPPDLESLLHPKS